MVIEMENETKAFPEAWEKPAHLSGTFHQDAMHFPNPLSPLANSSLNPAFAVGLPTAAQELNAPMANAHIFACNWYRFEQFDRAEPKSEAEARAFHEQAEATMKVELGRLGERWHQEHLPAIRAILSRLAEAEGEIQRASAAQIVAIIDEAEAAHRELWTIHFRIAFPMLLGMQLFDEFYQEVFGGTDGDSHVLLLGVESESMKAAIGLSDLANSARDLDLEPALRENPADQLLSILGATEPGRKFLVALDAYLDEYGYRQDLFDMASPTWREDRTIPLANIRNYLVTGREARAEYESRKQSAEAATKAAREQLASYPEAIRGQFEGMLGIARVGSFLQEEHNFYIDQQGLARLHDLYLSIGRRLVQEGVLAEADDVFMLLVDELRNLFANPDAMAQTDFVRALVQRRHEEMEIAKTLTPPPFLGDPPQEPPAGDPMVRAMGRFFGGPPLQSAASDQLQGNPGSRGTVSGKARVARTLDEAMNLQPGEILVAVTTMPPWTPLFGIAAAVVTETGGPLSHCAIVAREYGIPAVVGAHGATSRIATGQTISVDGGTGVVTLHE